MINVAISYLEKREVLATWNVDARDLDEKYCNILYLKILLHRLLVRISKYGFATF